MAKEELIKKEADFDLDVEVFEVSSATVLESMGASKAGTTSCSVVIQTKS